MYLYSSLQLTKLVALQRAAREQAQIATTTTTTIIIII